MATNPNFLSDADYWARANATPEFVGPPAPARGLAAIAGGSTGWGSRNTGGRPWFIDDLARRMETPEYTYPAGWQPSSMPAYPESGAHMTMPGSREAYQQWGIPPIMMQTSPYATAAYRTFTDPYGQMGVQPLIGFPSAYPHVLPGVPNHPFSQLGFINGMLPQAGFIPFMGLPGLPTAQPRAQAPARVAKVTNTSGVTRTPSVTTVPGVNAEPQEVVEEPLEPTMRGLVLSEPPDMNVPGSPLNVYPRDGSRRDGTRSDWWTGLARPQGDVPVAAPEKPPVYNWRAGLDEPEVVEALEPPIDAPISEADLRAAEEIRARRRASVQSAAEFAREARARVAAAYPLGPNPRTPEAVYDPVYGAGTVAAPTPIASPQAVETPLRAPAMVLDPTYAPEQSLVPPAYPPNPLAAMTGYGQTRPRYFRVE